MANIIGYNVYVDGVKYNDNPLRTFRHLVTGLTNGQEYEFTVRAVDEFGNESGDSVSVFETPDGLVSSLQPSSALAYTFTLGYTPGGITFSPDGSKMFVIENSNPGKIHRYNLSFPYYIEDDPAIAQTLVLTDRPGDLDITPDGTQLFTTGNTQRVYSLSAAWDIISPTLMHEITDIGQRSGIAFSYYGYRMYLLNQPVISSSRRRYELEEYELPSPWNITHAKRLSFYRDSGNHTGFGLTITSNGLKFYSGMKWDESTDPTWGAELTLNTPYSLSDGVSFTKRQYFDYTLQRGFRGISFNSDYSSMFATALNPNSILEYTST